MTAAENAPQLRSRLVQVLNVAQRLRLRLGLRLRPCWMTVLSSLLKVEATLNFLTLFHFYFSWRNPDKNNF